MSCRTVAPSTILETTLALYSRGFPCPVKLERGEDVLELPSSELQGRR